MNVVLTYRGRQITDADVAFVRKLIAENPAMHRRAISLASLSGLGVEAAERRAEGWRLSESVAAVAPSRTYSTTGPTEPTRQSRRSKPAGQRTFRSIAHRCALLCANCSLSRSDKCGAQKMSRCLPPFSISTTNWATPSLSANS